jgi:hypothetical protein
MTERTRSMPLGVVVERRALNNPWQSHEWRPVSVISGAGPVAEWKLLAEGPGWARYHAATLTLELHRKETDAYRTNLSSATPSIFVRLMADESGESAHEVVPRLVTASPFEAQDYLDSGADIVEGVAMPPDVIAWVQAFIDKHHVDEPFKKRQRQPHSPAAHAPRRLGPVDLPRTPPHKGNGLG